LPPPLVVSFAAARSKYEIAVDEGKLPMKISRYPTL
jgi:hypothetical protein